MLRNYVHGVRFIVETDAHKLQHQLNLPANGLPGALLTSWMVWIRLFNFDGKHVPGRVNEGSDGLSWQPRGEEEPEPEEEDDVKETIETSLQEIFVERGPEQQRSKRAFNPVVRFRLAEEYNARRKDIAKFLGDMKQMEGKITTEMHQFRLEAMKSLHSDGVLYWQRRTDKLPAQVSVSTEQI